MQLFDLFFESLLIKIAMKLSTFYKWSQFPHSILRKSPLYQQWNPLRRLSKVKKRIFRSRNRLYTIDFRFPLSKEIFLKIIKKKAILPVLKSYKNSKILSNSSTKWQKSLLKKSSLFSKPFSFAKNLQIAKNLQMPQNAFNYGRKAYSLNVFRFVFFKKNWILYNPSLVPGIVRPFKFKKKILLKIKALKGLHNLIGNLSLNFLRFLLKKSINMSNAVVPILWNLPRTVDSLKATVFLKLGFVFTIPIALALISQKQVSINGFKKSQIQSLTYPGDYLTFQTQSLPIFDSLFKIDSVSKYLNHSNRCLRRFKSRKHKKNLFYGKAKRSIELKHNEIA